MNTSNVEEQGAGPGPAAEEDFIRCPGCNAAGYDDDRFCSCCGEVLGNRCGWCGFRITHPVAHFCSQCGVPLAGFAPHRQKYFNFFSIGPAVDPI